MTMMILGYVGGNNYYKSSETLEERERRLKKFQENVERSLKKLEEAAEEERTRPRGFTEGVASILFGEDKVRQCKRNGREIRWF